MKILEKIIKECDTCWNDKTTVLILKYSHKWKTWEVYVRDYDDTFYNVILKQIRKEVYKLNNSIWV